MSEADAQTQRLNAIAGWFLGPRAENVDLLQAFFQFAAEAQNKGRNSYFPDDPSAITPEMKHSEEYKKGVLTLLGQAMKLSDQLAKHHVPIWNPRYNGHMSVDTTLPSQIGYLITMIYNPNNVASEASPLTTFIEKKVGEQLCNMVGINTDPTNGQTVGWGHVTCGGSIANLEAVWSSRNLKFYPLSLVLAMEGPLKFIADTFEVRTCQGKVKLLKDFTTWELLNIAPDDVLNMPDHIGAQYGVSSQFLTDTMGKYLVQSVPRDDPMFTDRFGTKYLNHMAIVISATKHYSWPKAAAVTGIGSNNVIDVTVDDDARMSMDDLRLHLEDCLANERPVYMVTAIIGSTEHGACDPLKDVLDMRREFQARGLSFTVHADGAWGTYFHTILNETLSQDDKTTKPWLSTALSKEVKIRDGFPFTALKPKTRESLLHLRHCESVTCDPHKSGYIQYPAGGLLYRDGRMRYLVTWTSPYIYRGDVAEMGVYGIEGSKPGAAPAAVFLSHNVLGLDKNGYGTLLAEGIYSCVKMYARLITMSTPTTDYRVRTLQRPPVEIFGNDDNPNLTPVRRLIEKRFYENEDGTMNAYPNAKDRRMVEIMGSDLSINTFAVNFRVNGVINKDVVEANDLNKRIFDRCAIVSKDQDINTIPVILTSTVLKQAAYRQSLTNFKRRLGLEGDQDLYVLINVVASPYPMMHNYTDMVMNDLKKIIEEEVKLSQKRNTITPSFHGFVLQGTDKIYGTHLPMFNMANSRQQLIITGDLPDDIMQQYLQARLDRPEQFFTLSNAQEAVLDDMVNDGEFDAVIDIGLPHEDGSHFLSGFKITNVQVIKRAPLDSKYLTSYPANNMPFYIYGDTELHIDHVLLASPNIQLSSDRVTLVNDVPWYPVVNGKWSSDGPSLLDSSIIASKIKEGKDGEPYLLHFSDIPESAMQPFPDNETIAANPSFFFRANEEYQVFLSEPGDFDMQRPFAKGVVRLSDTIFIDTNMLNMNPAPELKFHILPKGKHVPLSSAWNRYAKSAVVEGNLPLLVKPTVPESKKWAQLVDDLANATGTEDDYQLLLGRAKELNLGPSPPQEA